MAGAGFFLPAAILCLSFFIPLAMATQFVVGDSHGWSIPSSSGANYSSWAEKHRFHVGDILLFNYSAETDNILEVNRGDFVLCRPGNAISTHSDGATEIRLTRPGPHYFICGVLNHCAEGQKISLIVAPSATGHGNARAPAPAPAQAPAPSARASKNGSTPLTSVPAPAPISSTTNVIASPLPILASCIILVAFSFFS